MKIKLYVQEEDLITLNEFFTQYDNMPFDEKDILKKKVEHIEYFLETSEFDRKIYLGRMAEILVDFDDYYKLEYLE